LTEVAKGELVGKLFVEEWRTLDQARKRITEAIALHDEERKAQIEERILFLLALHNVAKAHGISELALASGLNRESFYRALSPRSNPKVTTLMHLLGTMGLPLGVQVATRHKHSAKPHTQRQLKKAS
jgi:probable addiction module antidote protein